MSYDYEVSSGMVYTGSNLNDEWMCVSRGGVVNRTSVNRLGYLYVSSGGIANSTTVNSGGWIGVLSGGIANSTTVNEGGWVYVEELANSTTVNSGGMLVISSGGTATNVRENGGYVSSGFCAKVSYVSNSFSDMTLFCSSATVHSGTTANRITVASGGSLFVFSNGSANGITVASGGSLLVFSNGSANGITISSSGTIYVSEGGTATDIIWTPCVGKYSLYNSAYATLTSQYSGVYCGSADRLLFSSNGLSSQTLSSGSSMHVFNGGKLDSMTINGSLSIHRGGSANSITIGSGGSVLIRGDAESGLVDEDRGGWGSVVADGGRMSNVVINSGGLLHVNNGGSASNIFVSSGGFLCLSVAPNTYAQGSYYNGSAFKLENGRISGYTVQSGLLDVCSGGKAENISFAGDFSFIAINSGGSAMNLALDSGARIVQFDVAPGTYVQGASNGSAFEMNNGVLSGYAFSLGSMTVSSGGTTNHTTAGSFGFFHVSSGGTAIRTMIDTFGYMYVSSGGVVIDPTMIGSGNLIISNGGKITGRMSFGSSSNCSADCEAIFDFDLRRTAAGADDPLVDNWSSLYGMPIYTLTVDGSLTNGIYKLAGGAAGFDRTITVVNNSGSQLGSLSVGQTSNIGGVNYTLYLADGTLNVARGIIPVIPANSGENTGSDASVISKGSRDVLCGQAISLLTVSSGGKLYVFTAGAANSTTVNSGGFLFVFYNGKANRTTINSGGWIDVHSGGTANDTTVSGGYFIVESGGKITGRTTLRNAIYLSIGYGAIIDFDLTRTSPGGTVLLDDLSRIQSTPLYTLTVDGSLTNGIYKLAGGAAGFSKSISVVNTSGTELGTLTVGRSASINGTNYSLTLSGDSLTVTVGGPVIDTTPPEITRITGSPTTSTTGSVTVSASFTDNVGVTATYYKLGESGIWRTYSNSVTVTDNTTVSFKAIDAAGNESNVYSYVVNNIVKPKPAKPTASADITATTRQAVTVTASFGSDTVTKQYSLDGQNWSTYSSGIRFTQNGTVYFRGINSAGTASDVSSYTVSNIDLVAPEISRISGSPTSSTTGSVTVSAAFTDNVAVASTYYKLGESGIWRTYSNSVTVTDNTTVSFKAIDAAGNESNVYSYVVNNIVKPKPAKPTASADITATTRQAVTVTASFGSDTVTKQYSLDGQNWSTYSSGVRFTQNGTVYFRGLNSQGTASDVTSYTVSNIDLTAPEISRISGSPTSSTTGSVTVSASFTDNVGVTATYYKLGESGTWRTYSNSVTVTENTIVSFKAVDSAGNESNVYSYVVNNIGGNTSSGGSAVDFYGNNHSFTSAYYLGSNTSIRMASGASIASSGEEDYYSFTLTQSATVTLTTSGVSGGDTVLYLYNSNQAQIASNDDSGSDNYSRVSQTLAPGTYYAKVRAYGNRTISNYSLSASVQTIGGNTSSGGSAVDFYGNNHSFASAYYLGSNTSIRMASGASIASSGEEDYYSFTLTQSATVTLTTSGVSGGDTVLYLYGADQNQLEYNDDMGGSYYSRVSRTLGPGTYYAKVRAFGSSTISNYSLSASVQTIGGNTSSGGSVISGGTRIVSAGQTSSGLTVASGGRLIVSSGGMANSTTVNSYGSMYVFSGGAANDTTINSRGSLIISSGGLADSTVINWDGNLYVSDGGVADNTVIYRSGSLILMDGGRAENTNATGKLIISSGGVANNTILYYGGGDIYLSSGGVAISTTINYGTGLKTFAGGTAFDTIINSRAVFHVSSDVIANRITIQSAASVTVLSGGTANDITVNYGGIMFVSSGGKLTGHTEIKNGATVSASSGTILDFDISSLAPGAAARVNDLSLLSGWAGATFTLTVGGSQANSTYSLAENAFGFNKTISVVNDSGTSLGTLAVGQTATLGRADYTLNLTDGNLSVTVVSNGTPEPEPEPVAGRKLPSFTGDFIGNGKSLLAVKDENAVRIYRNNGTVWSELTLTDGWDIAGIGDFNGDGADDILRVNDEGYVVGEISQGDGTFTPQVLNFLNAGWDILGTGDFNHNGVDDVLIANPTGASDTVGLLGYWEGGVTWTLINGYSAEWECVATGDFNGDGKCDMLWRNSFVGNGGLTYNAYCTWIVDPPAGQSDWRMVSVANPSEWNFLCSGDFDGNGSHDIAMINGEGVVGIWGVADGHLNSWSILSAVDPSSWALAGVGDFNGDGTDDIAWSNTETGLTGYWQINDRSMTSWQNLATLQAAP